MRENDSTDGARAVKPDPARPKPAMVRGEVYSTAELEAAGFDERRIAAWKKRGLQPLDFGTKGDFFLADDIIDLGRQKGPQP